MPRPKKLTDKQASLLRERAGILAFLDGAAAQIDEVRIQLRVIDAVLEHDGIPFDTVPPPVPPEPAPEPANRAEARRQDRAAKRSATIAAGEARRAADAKKAHKAV